MRTTLIRYEARGWLAVALTATAYILGAIGAILFLFDLMADYDSFGYIMAAVALYYFGKWACPTYRSTDEGKKYDWPGGDKAE